MIFAYIFIAILLLAVFLLFVPLRILLKYEVHNKNQTFELILYIWKIPIKIPIKQKPKEKKEEPKKRKSFSDFKQSVSTFADKYHHAKEKLFDSLHYLREHTTCQSFRFTLHFGTNNAATTGILTGTAWATGTFLLRIIDEMIKIQNLQMNVYPDFNKTCFDVHISCILRVQTVHIINVGIRLFKVFDVFTQEDLEP